jgi:L,D-peptidoglycan transpeptidase YkuD (ErfK/YbiS/YcfS/YnhG family)
VSEILVSGDGWLSWSNERHRCALGRAGVVADKREGDGGTPAGRFRLRRVLYRADRMPRPVSGLPVAVIAPDDGWCDDPESPDYNRQVRLPIEASAEEMWRHDALYDLVVVIGHNDDPPVSGLGSAIFLHVAPPGDAPTAGCVGLPVDVLRRLVAGLDDDSEIEIFAKPLRS